MNDLFAFCILLFLVSFAVADLPTFCSNEKAKCETAGINVTCVPPSVKGCAKDVADKKADMTLASADDLVKNEAKLKIVYGEKVTGISENFVKYYGLAVVRNGTKFNLNELKGKKSCHTGAGKTAGWDIPVGYLLFTKKMEFKENAYKSAAYFFSESCVPGVSDKTENDEKITDKLCKLCNSTGATKCSKNDGYADHAGAFKCMAEGNLDRVAFFKQTASKEVFDNDPEKKYGDASGYQLLCKDGSMEALTEFKTCNVDKKPASAVVTSKDTSAETIKKYQDLLDSGVFAELKSAGIVSSGAEKFVLYTNSVKDYVGSYGDHYNAVINGSPDIGSAIRLSFALQVATIFVLLI